MQLYLNNKLAVLKKSTSFEFIAENHMLSGSDGYTQTITFPLKDCPENIAIFGHINRADFPKWHSSDTARLFRPPIFKNNKKSSGYFF